MFSMKTNRNDFYSRTIIVIKKCNRTYYARVLTSGVGVHVFLTIFVTDFQPRRANPLFRAAGTFTDHRPNKYFLFVHGTRHNYDTLKISNTIHHHIIHY